MNGNGKKGKRSYDNTIKFQVEWVAKLLRVEDLVTKGGVYRSCFIHCLLRLRFNKKGHLDKLMLKLETTSHLKQE